MPILYTLTTHTHTYTSPTLYRRIRTECESLGEAAGPIEVLPLYASLPPRSQQVSVYQNNRHNYTPSTAYTH
jgi:hypothetical protein